jgi:tetratricopeptide (TPR) repeat protein
LTYEYAGSYDRAIPDFDQALRLRPSDAGAFCGRGWAYAQKGDYDRAIQDYDQALRINPTYVKALSNRRLAYAQNGEYLRAMADRVHYLWLKFGTVRVILLAVMVAAVFGFISISKRFR